MRIKLKKEEATILLSSHFAVQAANAEAQAFLAQTNAFIEQHRKKQQEVVERIRKRVKGVPKTPLDLWDFTEVDRVSFEGHVNVPEEKERKKEK